MAGVSIHFYTIGLLLSAAVCRISLVRLSPMVDTPSHTNIDAPSATAAR